METTCLVSKQSCNITMPGLGAVLLFLSLSSEHLCANLTHEILAQPLLYPLATLAAVWAIRLLPEH